MRYDVTDSSGTLYLKSSYSDPYDLPSKPLSTLAIVLISVGGVIFIGIIIFIVLYFCKKKKGLNDNDVQNEQGEIISNSNYSRETENKKNNN